MVLLPLMNKSNMTLELVWPYKHFVTKFTLIFARLFFMYIFNMFIEMTISGKKLLTFGTFILRFKFIMDMLNMEFKTR